MIEFQPKQLGRESFLQARNYEGYGRLMRNIFIDAVEQLKLGLNTRLDSILQDSTESERLAEALDGLMATLEPRDRFALTHRYCLNDPERGSRTLEQVGELLVAVRPIKMGITRSRARSVIRKAEIRLLRRVNEEPILASLLLQ